MDTEEDTQVLRNMDRMDLRMEVVDTKAHHLTDRMVLRMVQEVVDINLLRTSPMEVVVDMELSLMELEEEEEEGTKLKLHDMVDTEAESCNTILNTEVLRMEVPMEVRNRSKVLMEAPTMEACMEVEALSLDPMMTSPTEAPMKSPTEVLTVIHHLTAVTEEDTNRHPVVVAMDDQVDYRHNAPI